MRHSRAIVALLGAVLLVPTLALGQANNALVHGRVLDPGGAVVAGASVEARNLETGLRRSTTTDPSGWYQLAALPIGRYELTASANGLASEVRSGVTLVVGQQATVDFHPKVAATAETMTVTAEAPIIDRTQSAITNTITTRQIDQLPLPNRDFTELASLTPGIQYSVTEDGSISANGGSGSSNSFLVDGVSGDADALGGQRTALSPDVVAEFQVLSGQFAAEFGRASGAVINVVTRSGANDMRGRVSGLYRNDSLAADNPYVGPDERTPFTQKVYSAFLGGPFKRDRAFYFASYERTEADQTTLVTVDPALLAALGQNPDRAVPNGKTINRGLGKFDFSVTPANQANVRLDFDNQTEDNYAVGGTATQETGATFKLKERNAVLSDTWILSERTINDFRLLRSSNKTDVTEVNCPGCPYISRPSVQTGKLASFPQSFEEKHTELVDAVTFQVLERGGDHSFKVGGDINRVQLPVNVPQFFDGYFIFTTDKPFDANDPATYPQLYVRETGDPTFTIDDDIYSAYVQDQWRLNTKLTLNLGVRWDYETHSMVEHEKTNFAPRVHFAWDPAGDGKTVVRGGGGMYYDPIFLNAPLIGEFLSPTRFTFEYILFPGYPDPHVGGKQIPLTLPPSVVVANTDAKTPRTDTLSLGASRELAGDFALSADLVWARGRNRMLLIDRNAPVNKVRPDPNFAQMLSIETIGRSDYKGLEVGLRKRFGGRYSMNAAYTLARNENTADSHRSSVSDSANPDSNYGSSLNDIRHTLNVAVNYAAPFGFNVGLGGSYRSGAPYNVTTGNDDNGDQNFNDRPPGVKRNSARGPSTSTVNLRLTRPFKVSSASIELIAEAFNIFDKTNPTSFIGNMKSPAFGQPTEVLPGAFGPRQIQLGARVDF